MDRFAKIRDNNIKEQNRRFRSVVEKYEDVAVLMQKKSALIRTFDTAVISQQGFQSYTKSITDINRKISAALENHGLPGNYLDPIYTCSHCEDKGYVYENGAVAKRCPNCNNEDSSITFEEFNLDLFSKDKQEGFKNSPYEVMERNLKTAKEYCEEFPDNLKKNLLFSGASGLGKSFLASCMCSAIADKGYTAVKVNAFNLIEDFKNKHVSGQPYPTDYFGCDFLAIDDIGTEPMYNNITVEYLFALINERIERGRATLYITNQSYDNCAARYDERLASRIFDGLNTTRMMFIGSNQRMGK